MIPDKRFHTERYNTFRIVMCRLALLLFMWYSTARLGSPLASFPGSCAWAEKKEPGTHCLRLLSSPRISGNLGNFRKTCPLHKPPRDMPTFHAREMPSTHYALGGRWRRSDRGNKLFAYRNYPCVRAFQLNAMARDWCNFSLWSLPIVLNEPM